MNNVVYINLAQPEDILMDKIMAEAHRLRNIVGRRFYKDKWSDIQFQLDQVDAALDSLEEFVNNKIMQEADDNAKK